MVNRMDALGGLLKRIGNFDPASFQTDFSARLILQKTIYLMQKFDLFIGYSYDYYLRGPYSPSLTRDAYELVKRFDKLPLVKFVEQKDEKHFGSFLVFIQPHLRDHVWLERTASILFHVRAYPRKSRSEIFLKVNSKIPSLSEKEFSRILGQLREAGLLERRK